MASVSVVGHHISAIFINVETGDEPLYRVQVTATDGLEKWVELYP